MKTLLIVIPLVLLCFLGCQQGEEVATVDVKADIQAIKDTVADINVAVNEADIEKLMSFYADDAVEILPNKPANIGKEAIRYMIQQMFDLMILQENWVVKDVKISGNLAVAWVAWSAIITPKTSGESGEGKGNWIMVFEKQSNGSWKFIYTIHSGENLIYPNQAE